jgi:hypothetical protein
MGAAGARPGVAAGADIGAGSGSADGVGLGSSGVTAAILSPASPDQGCKPIARPPRPPTTTATASTRPYDPPPFETCESCCPIRTVLPSCRQRPTMRRAPRRAPRPLLDHTLHEPQENGHKSGDMMARPTLCRRLAHRCCPNFDNSLSSQPTQLYARIPDVQRLLHCADHTVSRRAC